MSKISEILSQRMDQLVLEHITGKDLKHLRIYALRGEKHENGYLISEAHFLPNGSLHEIFISFDEDEETMMMIAIDNKIVSVLDSKGEVEGTAELYLNDGQYLSDDLVIVFTWNFTYKTKIFRFFTKPSSHKTITSSISYNNDDNDEPSFNEEKFKLEWYACRLHVYAPDKPVIFKQICEVMELYD